MWLEINLVQSPEQPEGVQAHNVIAAMEQKLAQWLEIQSQEVFSQEFLDLIFNLEKGQVIPNDVINKWLIQIVSPLVTNIAYWPHTIQLVFDEKYNYLRVYDMNNSDKAPINISLEGGFVNIAMDKEYLSTDFVAILAQAGILLPEAAFAINKRLQTQNA